LSFHQRKYVAGKKARAYRYADSFLPVNAGFFSVNGRGGGEWKVGDGY
jgi:hypothetical protein